MGGELLFSKDIVYYICDKVLKDTTLDVFYIISQHDGISKIDVLRTYQERLGIDPSTKKFRYTIDEAIATLLGTTFVDFYKDGTSDKYFLTIHGELAAQLMGELIKEKPDLLKASKVLASELKEGAN